MGYVNIDIMLAGMTSKQLSEWRAYFNVKKRFEKKREQEAKMKAKAEEKKGFGFLRRH